jgi:hypothetical protein
MAIPDSMTRELHCGIILYEPEASSTDELFDPCSPREIAHGDAAEGDLFYPRRASSLAMIPVE